MMQILDWLMQPVDPSRIHAVNTYLSWHARFMTLGWGVIAPFAVVMARYFKILPWQDWPRELDNPTWWVVHLKGQMAVILLSLVGLGFILAAREIPPPAPLHRLLGYLVVCFGLLQGLSGYMRGTKGGPTAPAPDGSFAGDHYDMTRRRLIFEAVHKSLGYTLLVVAACVILMGLWAANAPNWMWIVILGWWALLIVIVLWLQLRFGSYDTYQAHWGADEVHPGNRMVKQGWGTVRPGDIEQIWCKKGRE